MNICMFNPATWTLNSMKSYYLHVILLLFAIKFFKLQSGILRNLLNICWCPVAKHFQFKKNKYLFGLHFHYIHEISVGFWRKNYTSKYWYSLWFEGKKCIIWELLKYWVPFCQREKSTKCQNGKMYGPRNWRKKIIFGPRNSKKGSARSMGPEKWESISIRIVWKFAHPFQFQSLNDANSQDEISVLPMQLSKSLPYCFNFY